MLKVALIIPCHCNQPYSTVSSLAFTILVILFYISDVTEAECSSSLPLVAGGTMGGVAIGTIVTLVATVIFLKIRRSRSGTPKFLVKLSMPNCFCKYYLKVNTF